MAAVAVVEIFVRVMVVVVMLAFKCMVRDGMITAICGIAAEE